MKKKRKNVSLQRNNIKSASRHTNRVNELYHGGKTMRVKNLTKHYNT